MGLIRWILLASLLAVVSAYGGYDECKDYGYYPVCTDKYRTFPNQCYYELYNQGGYGEYHEKAKDGQCYDEGHPNYYDQYPQDDYSSGYSYEHAPSHHNYDAEDDTYMKEHHSKTDIVIVGAPPGSKQSGYGQGHGGAYAPAYGGGGSAYGAGPAYGGGPAYGAGPAYVAAPAYGAGGAYAPVAAGYGGGAPYGSYGPSYSYNTPAPVAPMMMMVMMTESTPPPMIIPMGNGTMMIVGK